MNEDRVDEFFSRANGLLGAGRFEEAVEMLHAGRDEASKENDYESEAFFSSIAGSFLASRSRDEEALEEYARAELCDPLSPAWKIASANQLLNLGRAAKVLEKAREVLACSQGIQSFEHIGYSLLGLAELALGRKPAAVKAFTASTDPARVGLLPAVGRDLRLAEKLLSAGVCTELCCAYLRDTLSKSQTDGGEALEGTIRECLERHGC